MTQTKLPLRSLYSVWHIDYPEHPHTCDGKSAGDAKIQAFHNARDYWDDVRYIDFRCRKLPAPQEIVGDAELLNKANAIVQAFCPHAKLALTREGVLVQWQTQYEFQSRIWITEGTDFYPIWHSRAPWGGTCSMAISQVIRWLEGKPTLPMGTWRHWCSDSVLLIRDNPDSFLSMLKEFGWPEEVTCVVCGGKPDGLDWWSNGDKSGPCCWGAPMQCSNRNNRDYDFNKQHWVGEAIKST